MVQLAMNILELQIEAGSWNDVAEKRRWGSMEVVAKKFE